LAPTETQEYFVLDFDPKSFLDDADEDNYYKKGYFGVIKGFSTPFVDRTNLDDATVTCAENYNCSSPAEGSIKNNSENIAYQIGTSSSIDGSKFIYVEVPLGEMINKAVLTRAQAEAEPNTYSVAQNELGLYFNSFASGPAICTECP
jgi:hypothetical protein